jgi:two-component system phosphate regulon sensor histidine kinase PhoR
VKRSLTPKRLALRAGLFIALAFTLLVVPVMHFKLEGRWRFYALLVPPFSFLGAYAIIYYLFDIFIQQKLKLIYRSIQSSKLSGDPIILKDAMRRDVFREVNKDVESWAIENKKALEELREQATFRREFIGNLSHELKTPLTIVQGNLLTLAEGAIEDKKIREKFLTRAIENVERLETLVKELDQITKLEAGRDFLSFEKFGIIELTEQVMAHLEEKAEEQKIKLIIKKRPKKDIQVKADRNKIHQVITNLLVNSINYGSEGGKTNISFDEEDQQVMVEIQDNGLGMAESHLNRIFERFYRVDKSRSRHAGGTGLGLAIVKHIIDAHDQTITVSSEEGKGSTFSFTLAKAK